MTNSADANLSEADAAARLGVSPETLRAWRAQASGPAFLKLGTRILYRPEDIAVFEGRHRHDPQNPLGPVLGNAGTWPLEYRPSGVMARCFAVPEDLAKEAMATGGLQVFVNGGLLDASAWSLRGGGPVYGDRPTLTLFLDAATSAVVRVERAAGEA